MTIEFFVPGIAKPGGSKKAFMHPTTKRIIVTDDSGKQGKQWRSDCKAFALQAMGEREPIERDTPLSVWFTFYSARPGAHSRTNGELKDWAPPYPTTRPDALKLARAVEDAMTGIVYQDDAQIVIERIEKCYGPRPGCRVKVEVLK